MSGALHRGVGARAPGDAACKCGNVCECLHVWKCVRVSVWGADDIRHVSMVDEQIGEVYINLRV